VRGRKSREDGPAVAEAKDVVALSAFEVEGRTLRGSSTCVVFCQYALPGRNKKKCGRWGRKERKERGGKGKPTDISSFP
jgi:hypothetical protein